MTLSDQLKATGLLDIVGGAAYLTELTNFVPTAAHVEQYAEIVAQKRLRRRLIKACQDITDWALTKTKELQELIEEAETDCLKSASSISSKMSSAWKQSWLKVLSGLDELHKDKGKIRGVPTGFKDMDNILAGLQRSDLFILAARPSMGKTALALNLAHNVAVKVQRAGADFSAWK